MKNQRKGDEDAPSLENEADVCGLGEKCGRRDGDLCVASAVWMCLLVFAFATCRFF